jgi:FkbM family methyltransferase
LPHTARSWRDLPGPLEAATLLDTLTGAPGRYAPVPADKPLALYGAGNLGRLARDFLRTAGLDFDLVLDRRAAGVSSDFGAPILRPEDVPQADRLALRVAVSVVTAPYVPIEHKLLELGFTDVVPFYDLAESFRHRHPLSNGWFAAPLSAQARENIATVLARFDDDVSRAHHLQFLAWRLLREEWTFAPEPPSIADRFFIPEIASTLHDAEVFIDGGAFHGDIAEAFAAQTENRFKTLIAVEPDPESRAALERAVRKRWPNEPRLSILDCALADSDGVASFHAGLGYASQLSAAGQVQVKTRRLDALDLAPSFIKLHLEGGELAALRGARETLCTHRPMIAATVYHNADGLWQTPLWLMETLSDYRFLFRNHAWCGTGAVLYAIPAERAAKA